MRRFKKRTLWIAVAIAFILAIGLIIACTQVKGNWTKVLIVLIAIDFMFLTITVQMASYQTFRYKAKPQKYPTKDFSGDINTIKEKLTEKKYKERKTPYGSSFLKVIGDTAYKCVLVQDTDKYFNHNEEDTPVSSNKELDKCSKFIGLEIFYSIDEQNLLKLPEFSLQGKNIYYTALLYQENQLFKCLNYNEPEEDFKTAFDTLFQHIGLTEVVEEPEETQA